MPFSGNSFDSDFSSVYLPFLEILYEFPDIPFVINFSGRWYSWFDENHPEISVFILEMQKKRKQFEFISGGYYEPCLSLIHPQDRIGQIDALNTVIRQKFGKRPRGCRIEEGHWDSSVVSSLRHLDIEYLFIDKSDLIEASIHKVPEYHVSITEDQGKTITVFPLADRMLDKAPEMTPAELCQKILQVKGNDPVVSIFFNRESLSRIGFPWVKEFFHQISTNRKINVIIPSRYNRSEYDICKEYLQCRNMIKRHLLDSREGANLYSKMTYVQTLINQIRGDKYKKKSAQEHLWEGQGYFSFFSHPATGLAYSSFIEAEKLTRTEGVFCPSLIKTDYRLEGFDQYLYHGFKYNAYLRRTGASVFEYDNIQPAWNYVSHVKANERTSLFIDYFLKGNCFIGDSAALEEDIQESMEDTLFDVDCHDREKKKVALSCRRKNPSFATKLNKTYFFHDDFIEVVYEVVNVGGIDMDNCFATSFNFSLNITDYSEKPEPVITDREIRFSDRKKTIRIRSEKSCCFVYRNIFSSDGKYVATLVYAVCCPDLISPGKSWTNRFEFSSI